MRRTCLCGEPTIVAREIDGAIRVVDAEPTTDVDSVVLTGDLDDQPGALWGIDPAGDTMPWGRVIEAGAPRYRRHVCREDAK